LTEILITGGRGFIGTNLVKNLVDEGGHFIRIVDNLSAGSREDLSQVCSFIEIDPSGLEALYLSSAPAWRANSFEGTGRVELVVADVLDDQFAVRAAEGTNVIVHLAANTGVEHSVFNPRSDCMTNVVGTLNYLEAARKNGVKRFVFASSCAPVGECDPPINEDVVPHPVSPYGASKLAGEGYCSAYYHVFGTQTVALRFANVYGPLSNSKNSVIAKFIRQALAGETLYIHGDGKQTRDFIYIDDLVKAIYQAATLNQIGGELFQIATGIETTISKLAKMILPILLDLGIDEVRVDHSDQRAGDVRRNFSDVRKAEKILGWKAQVELDEGLDRTLRWFSKKNRRS